MPKRTETTHRFYIQYGIQSHAPHLPIRVSVQAAQEKPHPEEAPRPLASSSPPLHSHHFPPQQPSHHWLAFPTLPASSKYTSLVYVSPAIPVVSRVYARSTVSLVDAVHYILSLPTPTLFSRERRVLQNPTTERRLIQNPARENASYSKSSKRERDFRSNAFVYPLEAF